MTRFVLQDVLEGTRGVMLGGERGRFDGLSTDSRSLAPGQLFWALEGERFDGHDHVGAALERGAAGAVVRRGFSMDAAAWPNQRATLVAVEDTLTALGDFAAHWRRRKAPRVAAITGSNGKTTTKEMTARVLARRFSVLATHGNLNNLIGLPLTLLRLEDEQVAVVELGMSVPGEIRRLTEIARPHVAVITQVAPAHLEGLGSVEGVADAKWELFDGLEPTATALLNLDDPMLAQRAERLGCECLSFGSRDADLVATAVEERPEGGVRFAASLHGAPPVVVELALIGRHNVSNALAALAAGIALGVSLEEGAAALAHLAPIGGRMRPLALDRAVDLIDDTYNANPVSLEAALEAVERTAGERIRIAVLGEMRELGEARERAHLEAGRAVAHHGFDALVAVGEVASLYGRGARDAGLDARRVVEVPDAADAIPAVLRAASAPALVLVKGSRGAHMERVVDGLRAELGERG